MEKGFRFLYKNRFNKDSLLQLLFRTKSYKILWLVFFLLPVLVMGQDNDSLSLQPDTTAREVYKPVLSFSYGIINFRGDVQNSQFTTSIGTPAAKLNLATFIDKKNYFVLNFNFTKGKLSATSYSHSELERNLNFKTDLTSGGMNLEYRFGHLLSDRPLVQPYISLGLESIYFSPKGDLNDANDQPYYYWTDGTIRDEAEALSGTSGILYRDYTYETDLRLRETEEFGLGNYSQWALSIPAGMGFHFRVDRRAFLSLGVSYHHTLTDFLDNVAYEGTSIKGNKGTDRYIYTHVSFHYDLFSLPIFQKADLLYTDINFDPLLFDDEDEDLVLDVSDRCPGTPPDVEVDSLGCPLDGDMDGVANYLDKEPDTAPGAWVDDEGQTVSEDEFLDALQSRYNPMAREDVDAYTTLIMNNYRLPSASEIPERYRALDEDGDGYISFEELLKTIDQYFDFQLDLSLDELREVNEFFFSQ